MVNEGGSTETLNQEVTNTESSKHVADQLDINEIVEQRLARDRKTREPKLIAKRDQELLDRFGVESFDHLEEIVNKHKGSEDIVKKEQRAVEQLKKQNNDLMTMLQKQQDQINQRKIDDTVTSFLSEHKLISVEDTKKLLKDRFRIEDDSVVAFDDEMNIVTDQKSIKKMINNFLSKREYLLAPTVSGGSGSRPNQTIKTENDSKKVPDTFEGRKSRFLELTAKGLV